MSAGEVHAVTVPIIGGGTTSAIGTTIHWAFFVPSFSTGGGLTITRWGVCMGTAVGSGSAPAFTLVTTTSAGVVNGTVGKSGSAAYTSGTPVAGTVTTAFVSAGYGLAIRREQDQVCPGTHFWTGYIQYELGK